MKKFKIKCFCKINLFLRVTKKVSRNYHEIRSLVTFCNIYDIITISKNKYLSDKITFTGRFKNKISKKNNIVKKLLVFLRKEKLIKKQYFNVNIKKNIPHGSGLGGGSSNAAGIINFLYLKKILKVSENKKYKIARKMGFDVPIFLKSKNYVYIGKNEKIYNLKNFSKLNILIVYPNIVCSTKKIYKANKLTTPYKTSNYKNIVNREKLIHFLFKETNDLEQAVTGLYPKIAKVINLIKKQQGC